MFWFQVHGDSWSEEREVAKVRTLSLQFRRLASHQVLIASRNNPLFHYAVLGGTLVFMSPHYKLHNIQTFLRHTSLTYVLEHCRRGVRLVSSRHVVFSTVLLHFDPETCRM